MIYHRLEIVHHKGQNISLHTARSLEFLQSLKSASLRSLVVDFKPTKGLQCIQFQFQYAVEEVGQRGHFANSVNFHKELWRVLLMCAYVYECVGLRVGECMCVRERGKGNILLKFYDGYLFQYLKPYSMMDQEVGVTFDHWWCQHLRPHCNLHRNQVP